MEKYTLSFSEAVEKCLKGEGFIRGNGFDKGVYIKPKNGVLYVVSINKQGWHEELNPFMITVSTALEQKYKLFSVASKKELEMEGE